MVSYLEEKIEWYDHNYRMGNALITDQQFDKLEANLYRVNPNANYFNKKSLLSLPSLPKNEIKEFLKKAKSTDLYKQVIEKFPDANLVDVKPKNNIEE